MALDYNIIGERIKLARTKSKTKLTQEKLAEKLEVSVPYLSRVECGDAHINLTRLNQICEILGVTEGEILNGTSTTSSNYLYDDFANLLSKCSHEKAKLIYNIAKMIVEEKDN